MRLWRERGIKGVRVPRWGWGWGSRLASASDICLLTDIGHVFYIYARTADTSGYATTTKGLPI